MLVGAVIGGFAGLMLAGYALLWLSGPNLDVFYMGSWLPKSMLPASMRMAAEEAVRTNRQTTSTPTEPVEDAGDEVADEPPSRDEDTGADDSVSRGASRRRTHRRGRELGDLAPITDGPDRPRQ